MPWVTLMSGIFRGYLAGKSKRARMETGTTLSELAEGMLGQMMEMLEGYAEAGRTPTAAEMRMMIVLLGFVRSITDATGDILRGKDDAPPEAGS